MKRSSHEGAADGGRLRKRLLVGIFLLCFAVVSGSCGRGNTQKAPSDSAASDGTEGNGLTQQGNSGQQGNSSQQGGPLQTETGDGQDTEEGQPGTEDEEWLIIERAGEESRQEAEDGTLLFISGLYYPEIRMPDNPEAADQINRVFASQKEEDGKRIEEYKEWAAEDYKERLERGEEAFWSYALDRDYIVAFRGEKLLSVKQVEYSYAGGAHPSNYVLGWNFDLTDGRQAELEQLTDDPENFQHFLYEFIVNYLEDEQLEDGVALIEELYPDYRETVAEVLKQPVWYVEESNLKIVFNEYNIAPYAAGIIEVEIPLQDADVYWNEYARMLIGDFS